jgi:hypothetical protein
MMIESDPVPNGSPNMTRLQNSTVAHAKGKTPAIKTQTSVFCQKETAAFTTVSEDASATRWSVIEDSFLRAAKDVFLHFRGAGLGLGLGGSNDP